MSSLFDTNRISLKKLFTAHEKEGSLKFTDLLKLCSSTRIFPDLLGSPELHKIIVEVVQDPSTSSISQQLAFAQFEIFLRTVAAKAFPLKSESEQECLLFIHLKSSCGLRYSVDFETMSEEKKKSLNKKVPRLNIESAKMQRKTPNTTRRISVKPFSTKNVKSSSFLFRNSPRKESLSKQHKGHAFSIITPRMNIEKVSAKPSPRPQFTERPVKKTLKSAVSLVSSQQNPSKNKISKIAKIFWKFQQKENVNQLEKNIKAKRLLRLSAYVEKKSKISMIQARLFFRLWSLLVKKCKF